MGCSITYFFALSLRQRVVLLESGADVVLPGRVVCVRAFLFVYCDALHARPLSAA